MSPTEKINADIEREGAERELLHLEYDSLQSQIHALSTRFRVMEMAQKMAALRGDVHGDEIGKLRERLEVLRSSVEGLASP